MAFRKFLSVLVLVFAFASGTAHGKGAAALTTDDKAFFKAINSFCVGNWDVQACMKTLSQTSQNVAANYAESLDSAGYKRKLEALKQGCAASTAAIKVDVPAYAMKSALAECANIISDLVDQTKISPNLNRYQLLVAGVLCIGKDQQCSAFEQKIGVLSR